MAHLQQHGNNRKTLETCRLEDEDYYEYEIWILRFFSCILKNRDPGKALLKFFSPIKTVIFIERG